MVLIAPKFHGLEVFPENQTSKCEAYANQAKIMSAAACVALKMASRISKTPDFRPRLVQKVSGSWRKTRRTESLTLSVNPEIEFSYNFFPFRRRGCASSYFAETVGPRASTILDFLSFFSGPPERF
jgi:hypothetical protein